MEINRNNYEAYLLDLMEGNLSMEAEQALRKFLKRNPECGLFPDDPDPWILEKKFHAYPGKEELKKELPRRESVLSESNFDLFSIARLEGDLSPAQELEHEVLLERQDEKRKEWALWQHTRLKVTPVEYPGKEGLKRRTGRKGRIIWLSVISAAAAVALLFALFRTEADLTEMEVAEEAPTQNSVTGDRQTEERDLEDRQAADSQADDRQAQTVPSVSAADGEVLAIADEPVMFSIRKQADRPIVSGEKGKGDVSDPGQDSLRTTEPEEIQSRPLRLASYDAYGQELLNGGTYDQIKPLVLPPSDIHLSSLSLAQISEIDLQGAIDVYAEEKNISLWSIANAGIKGINRVTGSDISLLASRDEEGEISGFRFKSKRFSFTRPIDRPEEYSE
jgi:hypothetical protein